MPEKSRRTTHRSVSGTKLYAVRDAKGRLQCPKMLWWKVHEPEAPELVAGPDIQLQHTHRRTSMSTRQTIRRMLAMVALVLGLGGPALAQSRGEPVGPPIDLQLGVTLSTPPLLLDGGFTQCHVVNVSGTSVLVAVRIFDAFGNLVDSESCGLLEPGRMCVLFVSGQQMIHCRITVVGGADAVRGALQVLFPGNGGLIVEAR